MRFDVVVFWLYFVVRGDCIGFPRGEVTKSSRSPCIRHSIDTLLGGC
jgi:hypothetical protein